MKTNSPREKLVALDMAKKKLPQPITDIPPEEVGEVVQSFIDNDGVKQMDVKQQADGNFKVTPEK